MATSVFIAKLLGLTYLVIGVSLLNDEKQYRSMLTGFLKDSALMYFGGILSFVVGVTIVLLHNHWVGNWTILITLIGWMATVKGVVILVAPKSINEISQYWLKHMHFAGMFVAGLGLVFSYYGFMA